MSLVVFPRQFVTDVNGTPRVGAKANVYAAGTVDPITTWKTSAYDVPHSNPVLSVGGGLFPAIYIDPSVYATYKLFITDAADAEVYNNDNIPTLGFTAADVGAMQFPLSTAEQSANLTDDDIVEWIEYGNVRRYGLNSAASAAANNTAFQNALTANAGAYPVRVPKAAYDVSGRFTAPAGTHIILEDGAELHWTSTAATGSTFLGTATRPGIEVTGDNFRIEGKGTLRGPSSATFVSNEIGIFAKGTSTSARKSGFVVRDVELLNWGTFGAAAQFVDRVEVSRNYVHDCGYSGIALLSCSTFRVQNNHVKDITPGAGGLGYGIQCTHDSTDYDNDPDIATPRAVANPFCIDGDISDNTVENLSVWTGIDCHGGYELVIARNKTYNCRIGIALAGSSGDAADYSGENNAVLDNFCTTLQKDGSATTIAAVDRYGIVVAGGATVPHSNITVRGNTTYGYGDTVITSYSIHAARVRNATISENTILSWQGNAIYTSDGDGLISENVFGGVSSTTNSCCVFLDVTTGTWQVSGNKHRPVSGTAAAEGLRLDDASSPRCLVSANDFDLATAPYIGFDGTQTRGDSQIVPQITVTGTPTSVDIAAVGQAPRVRLYFDTSGSSTVADFANARVGQIIECYFPTTNVTTVDRTNAALAGGANFASSQYDVLVLEVVNTTGIKFVERSRAANS